MDKSCHSSADSTTTNASSSINKREQYLIHLNKISHKITKPIRKPTFDHHHHHQNFHQSPPQNLQQQQQQPPVYNIKKSDFRDVVQKLTGSPAHDRLSTPPPIQPPKPPSSRLQRFRPPPLAQISNRPSPLLNIVVSSQPPPAAVAAAASMNPNNPVSIAATPAVENNGNFCSNQRQVAPFSPLPPFPAVHAAAESPISAYLRYLQSTVDIDPKRVLGLSPHPPPNQQQSLPPASEHSVLPSPTSTSMAQSPFLIPSSPLPFGCLPSPRSPYPLLSPSLLVLPSTIGQLGFQQLPASPRLPVPSPRWKDL